MIVQILAAAYSGSTLLDAILDSQPSIRGLGEVAQVWEDKPAGAQRGPCHLCGCRAEECAFWAGWFAEEAVNQAAGYMLDAHDPAFWARRELGVEHVVDASKAGHRFRSSPQRTCQIVLAKAPHEWVASVLAHHPERTAEGAWEYWIELHLEIFAFLERMARFTPVPHLLQYRDLTLEPVQSLVRVCDWLHTQADPDPVESGRFWDRKSHALGGNPAVIDQLAKNDAQTGGLDRWLGGKYAGRRREIRYDESWRRDRALMHRCATLYRACSSEMRELLQKLAFGEPEAIATSILK